MVMTTVDLIESKNIIVHRFRVGDSEDPDLYAADPLWQWQQSKQGQWVMAHAVETPIWHRQVDPSFMGWQYMITANLKVKDLTYFYIKWQKLS